MPKTNIPKGSTEVGATNIVPAKADRWVLRHS